MQAMADLPELLDPDRQLALGYAPAAARAALFALFALDERLGGVVARTGEPAIGLMRLTWWRDQLERLAADGGPAPAEPLLAALLSAGLDGSALAAMVPGWEALLDDPDLGPEAIAEHGRERGSRLFALAGGVLGAAKEEAARLADAGRGWALVDLSRHLDRPGRAAALRAEAAPLLGEAMARRWPRRLRPLGQLAALARTPDAAPRTRALAVLRHQITGR
jgi:15-cis-phytoene synthase